MNTAIAATAMKTAARGTTGRSTACQIWAIQFAGPSDLLAASNDSIASANSKKNSGRTAADPTVWARENSPFR